MPKFEDWATLKCQNILKSSLFTLGIVMHSLIELSKLNPDQVNVGLTWFKTGLN